MSELSPVYYIDSKKATAVSELGGQLQKLIRAHPFCDAPPVILCIGTDRVTGDSLGPLTGTFLQACGGRSCLHLYGTLDLPIHALNLADACRQIKKRHPRSLILAVDASLGTKKHLGYITLGQGSLRPGAGVQKKLAAIGDIFITGIINVAVPEAQQALQNTRLATVSRLSCCIAQGILYACGPQSRNAVGTLQRNSALQRPQQRHLVNVFQISANRNAAGDPADLNPGGFY